MKNIGIVGAGNIGGVLARHLTQLGYAITIANSRGPDTLGEVVARTGATAGTVEQAVQGQEMVIVTITQKAVPELSRELFASLPAETVVVDTGNYYPHRDGTLAEIEAGEVESRWVEAHLGRPVVKAFNCIYWQSLDTLGKPPGAPGRVALPVAGDEAAAKEAVLALVEALGFDALDAGGLDDSWRQQPGTPVYCRDYDLAGVKQALAEARRDRAAEYRAYAAATAK
ncbi:MAG: NAD(P)-binding domain-containing protein [Gluconacetobacter diazotrophicus]|nr:NAD(P)-binding domain-containing protein [Gluconacetobacter diazotrophicus]